jgi:arsenate reductase
MVIYGIKNCDTMQKAFKYLDRKKIKYGFHDYKTEGIDKPTILKWLGYFPMDKIINTRSTTFKNLPDSEKVLIVDRDKAIQLIIANPSMVKRPMVDLENGTFLLGFKVEEWDLLLSRKS